MSSERWRPLRSAEQFRPVRDFEEMARRFEEDIVRPTMRAVWERIPEDVKGWSPAVDVFEKGDTIVVRVELPGLKQESIDVSVSEDVLTVKGERNRETAVRAEEYYRNEIAWGSFYRSISLPEMVQTENIDAVYMDGILVVSLRKAQGAKPKKVSVQVKRAD
jgi:HSP20 family protein